MSSRVLVAVRVAATPARAFAAFTDEIGEWWRFSPGQVTEVHVRFEPVGEQTRVVVEHRGWDTIEPKHAARQQEFPLDAFLQREAEWWQVLLRVLVGHIQAS